LSLGLNRPFAFLVRVELLLVLPFSVRSAV